MKGVTTVIEVQRVPVVAWSGVLRAALDPGVTPNGSGLPGLKVVRDIAGALLTFGLVACVVGMVGSIIVWAVGSHVGNYNQTSGGKTGLFVSAAGALLIGGAPAIVKFFAVLGSKIS